MELKEGLKKIGSFAIIFLVLAAFVFPLTKAQTSTQQSNSEEQNSTLILLNITNKAISFAKSNGINVSLAENYYNMALSYYKQGNYTEALIEIHLAMKVLANEMEKKPSPTVPQAEGIRMQLLEIERFVNSSKVFSLTYKEMILTQVNQSLVDLNEGNVTGAAQMLSQIKHELMNVSIKISEVAKERVSHFIKHKIEQEANELSNVFSSELGNVTTEFSYNLNVTPVLNLIGNELEKNSTNISVNVYAHMLIAINNLENFIANQKISFVFNESGRSKALWPILVQLNAINDSLNRISRFTTNENITKAINLMEQSLNETKYSIKEWYVGNDTLALKLVNESIQNDELAQQYVNNATNAPGISGMLFAISNRIYLLDNMVLRTINSSIIIGKSVVIEGFVIWNLTQNSYLIVGHIISLRNFMGMMPVSEHMWQLMIVNVSKSTQIMGNIYPNETVKIYGVISGKYYAIYEVNATQIIVLNNISNINS